MRSDSKSSGPTFTELARRRQFVDCAIEVIAEQGFAAASLAKIAARAGTSKGVISYHFSGKDELLEQILLDVLADVVGFVEPAMAAATTATEKLTAYLESGIEYMRLHRAQLLALRQIFPNMRDADGNQRFVNEPGGARDRSIEEILTEGQRTGEFRRFDPTVMAVTIRAAVDGVLDHWAMDPDLDLPAYTRELVSLFIHATRGKT
ncbi:TetR/AcrR family transcriptional regulator [Amycolatopsis sp. NPDC059021]|uniref:TetR/AcrR family transcriptional regulator n=1 Tax=Amycolatopsis sp. NPDC059021 TaxID=3346704 RepID=UPI00367340C0